MYLPSLDKQKFNVILEETPSKKVIYSHRDQKREEFQNDYNLIENMHNPTPPSNSTKNSSNSSRLSPKQIKEREIPSYRGRVVVKLNDFDEN